MEGQRVRTSGRHVAGLVVLLAVLFPAGAQEPSADVPSIQVSAARIKRTERLTLDLSVPLDAPGEPVEVIPPPVPEILSLLVGPLVQPVKDPEGKPMLRYRYTFQGVRSGRRIWGPFQVRRGGKVYHTDPFLIEVSYRGDIDKVAYDVEWEAPERILARQSVPITLYIRHLDRIVLPDRVQIPELRGAFVEEVPVLAPVEEESMGAHTLYHVPVKTFMITPYESGTIRLPPATVILGGMEESGGALTVRVDPLPQSSSLHGVGRFEFYATRTVSTVQVGELFGIRLLVKGVGNFPFLSFPQPDPGDLAVLVREEEDEEYRASTEGYSGWRQRTYWFRAVEEGRLTVRIPPFRYVPPGQNGVRSAGGTSLAVEVREENVTPALTFLSLDEVRSLQGRWIAEDLRVLFLIIPMVLALFSLLVPSKRFGGYALVVCTASWAGLLLWILLVPPDFPLPEQELQEGLAFLEREDYGKAYEAFQEALDEEELAPGIHYDAAMAAYALGEDGRVVYHLRRACVQAPMVLILRKALSHMEEEIGLQYQAALPVAFPPGIPWLGLITGCTLSGLFFAAYIRWRSPVLLITLLLSLSATIVAGGYVFYRAVVFREPQAVVVSETPLQAVPEEEGRRLQICPAGTAVRTDYLYQDYVRVHTGMGTSGWVRRDTLQWYIGR
ncbi:hypothetical protein Spith_1735 [Spirochaeta thermophila DSM 6578]|uniref:Uncharacterized protein n=1 Tax=Winmispira thermophila (strain ATCC 700085 / DSM 6578 / Z-1203) TaxID=869211 RepID=G0GBY4_WINT7|nr:BatD family protein [Spirochaeta thermophila]AEJ61995.1 hypothetical protein Spith_1735 [Spirochaeta thermophila DSM 6578]